MISGPCLPQSSLQAWNRVDAAKLAEIESEKAQKSKKTLNAAKEKEAEGQKKEREEARRQAAEERLQPAMAVQDEIAALKAEQEMSVEELMAKFFS